MRMLKALGAPLALFGFLFQLLLPVTTAAAHQFDPSIAQVEICSRVGVKQLPATLAELVVIPAGSADTASEDVAPALQPDYCPGAAQGALAPMSPWAPVPSDVGARIARPGIAPEAPPAAVCQSGLGPRGPPATA